jgi:predicted Zn finger-like uncharacterized protein
MKTRCPNCETLYDIDEAALAAVDFAAVCCQCHQVFTAEKLHESIEPVASPPGVDPQEDPFAHADKIPETKIESSTPPPPEPGEENDWAFVQQRGIEESNKPKLSLATDVPEDFNSLAAAELPEHLFSKPRQQKNKPSLMVAAGIFVFTLLAAAQLAWVNKKQLLEHPQGRQIMQQFCDLAECELEQQKATDKFTVLHRNLQPSINHQYALSFTLSFTNDADFSQQLPRLQLSLLGHENHLLAQRSFSPDEYLYPDIKNDRSMQPMEIINVELLLQDRQPDVSGFKLEFL